MRRLAASLGLCAMAACKHAPPPEPRVVDLSHDFGADTIYWPTEEGFVHEPGSAGQTAGGYAQAAARALLENTDLPADQVVRKALEIAGRICIYTNLHITVETLGPK